MEKKKKELLKKFDYPYKYTLDGRKRILYGVMTNEPAIKYIMELLKADNDELDEIHYMASETVRNKMSYNGKKEAESSFLNQTHSKFFQERIKKYCKKNNIKNPEYKEYGINDNPNSIELINLSSEIAHNIIKLKKEKAKNKKFNLYIEANGGMRDFVLIVVAVLRTLENENIILQKVIGVNFNPNNASLEEKDTKNEIIDKTSAFLIYDLYSGIDEFINYGRSNKIKSYFDKSGLELTKSMKRVLDSIEVMSDSFNLCRPNDMLNSTKKLEESINIFKQSNESNNEKIFSYLIMRIENEYQEVFKKLAGEDIYAYAPLRQMIIYCLDHNLIQQAITLYSELMPHPLYNEKVLFPSLDEEIRKEFDNYMKGETRYPEPYVYIQQYMLVKNKLVSLYEKNKGQVIIKKKGIDYKCELLKLMLKDKYVATQYSPNETIKAMYNYLVIKKARNMSNHAGVKTEYIIKKYFRDVRATKDFIRNAIKQLDTLLID